MFVVRDPRDLIAEAYLEHLNTTETWTRLPRADFGGYSFQTLMVAVVSFGLGSLTERDVTLRTVLGRSVAAVDRLDFAGWLDRL